VEAFLFVIFVHHQLKMKKQILSALFLASAWIAGAQKNATEPLYSPKVVQPKGHQTTPAPVSAADRGGAIVFTEDFSNGFAGNNGIGAWLPWDTSADTSIWMLANANSPAGAYTSSAPAMTGPTTATGWIIFDADLYQGGAISATNPAEDVSGWLQSPNIDCSTLSSVVVDYNQYFIYCCFSTSPLTLEVSNDGGTTWVVFPGHGDFSPSANAFSANPLATTVDISCVAANQSNVMIRFGFNTAQTAGYSHYFWGLDDVSVHGNPKTNDIEVRQVMNGDVFNVWEYRLTPMEQHTLNADGGQLVGIISRNVGAANQSNVNVQIDITDAAGTVVHSQTEVIVDMPSYANAPECPAFVNDTMYVNTGWEPTATGVYTITVTMTADSTDETPANNVATRVIEFSTDEYGHDDTNLDIELLATEVTGSNPVAYEPHGYGTFFHFPYANSFAYGSTLLLGGTSDLDAYFSTVLYQATSGLNSSPAVAASNEFSVTQQMIGSTGSEPFYYLPFADPAEMLPGEVYFNCIVTNPEATTTPTATTDLQVTMLAQDNSDTDNSTAELSKTGSSTYAWFTSRAYSPALRLILSERVTVDEINGESLQTFKLFPNPAVQVAQVQYTLNKNVAVAYEVRDMQGKLVTYSNLGVKPTGTHTLELPVAQWGVGFYQVSLVVDGKKMYTKSLQVSK
jgi:hypothetical protein